MADVSDCVYGMMICTRDEFDDWKSGGLYLDELWGGCKKKFVTQDRAIQMAYESKYPPRTPLGSMSKCEIDAYLADNNFIYSYDEYMRSCEGFETYEESYVTKHGDEIVVFGYYGSDW